MGAFPKQTGRRIEGIVTLEDRLYRWNPVGAQSTFEPVPFPKDDQTIVFDQTIGAAAGGTVALGTYIAATGAGDTLVGDANWFNAGTIGSGVCKLEASVNGTVKRRWMRSVATVGETEINPGCSVFDGPTLRIPAGGTLILNVVFVTAGTIELGFSAYTARY